MAGERFGDRVHLWATHNEPWVVTVVGHLLGEHAPGIADRAVAARTHHHLLLAHGLGAQALRGAGVVGGVGIVLSETLIEPLHPDREEDLAAAERGWDFFGRSFRAPLLGEDYPQSLRYRDLLPVQEGDLASSPSRWTSWVSTTTPASSSKTRLRNRWATAGSPAGCRGPR